MERPFRSHLGALPRRSRAAGNAHPPEPLRTRITTTLIVLAALVLTVFTAAAAPLERVAADRLKLARASIQRLDVDPVRRAFAVPLDLGGRRVTLRLEPTTLRAEGFQLLVEGDDGKLRAAAPPALHTYRGSVDELPGTIAAGTVRDGRLTAAVSLTDGTLYFIEPMREVDAAADHDQHVVYLASDAAVEGSCAVAEAPAVVSPGSGGMRIQGGPRVADIAIDADYEFFQLNDSSVDDTVDDIETVLSGVNVAYQRDCDLTHRIATIIVRSNAADPYTATDSDDLYDELRVHWNTTLVGVDRDVVHLMTGKNLDGNVIGYAGVGVVCNRTRAYGLVQSRYSQTVSMSRRVALSAHELGHNWNAVHCDSSDPCNIMCSSINGCDGIGLPNFEPLGADAIRDFAASRSCLDTPVMAVGDPPASARLQLAAPTPSPFAERTQLRYFLGQAGAVRLAVYDITGQRVASLVDGIESAGWHGVEWNGVDARGRKLRAGVFYARVEAGGEVGTTKVILVR